MAPQQELSKPTSLLDLTEDWLDRDLAFGIQASPALRAQRAAHAVRDRESRGNPSVWGRRACPFVRLPIRRDQGPAPQRGEGLDIVFTIVASIQAGDLGNLAGIGDRLLQQRLRLLFVIRGLRHVGGDDDLCRRIDHGLTVIALDEAALVCHPRPA